MSKIEKLADAYHQALLLTASASDELVVTVYGTLEYDSAVKTRAAAVEAANMAKQELINHAAKFGSR